MLSDNAPNIKRNMGVRSGNISAFEMEHLHQSGLIRLSQRQQIAIIFANRG